MELKGLCRSKRYHKISQNSLLLRMAQEEKVLSLVALPPRGSSMTNEKVHIADDSDDS